MAQSKGLWEGKFWDLFGKDLLRVYRIRLGQGRDLHVFKATLGASGAPNREMLRKMRDAQYYAPNEA